MLNSDIGVNRLIAQLPPALRGIRVWGTKPREVFARHG